MIQGNNLAAPGGALPPPEKETPMTLQNPEPQQVQQAPAGQYPTAYDRGAYPVAVQNPGATGDGVGSWMLAQLISAIPVVGFIYLLVVAFGGTPSLSRRNWARALFMWQIIGVVAVVVLVMTGMLSASDLSRS